MEVMLALNPETSIEEILPYLDSFLFVQLLAVSPGPSGQDFNSLILEKIELLRERSLDIVIEVDGGMNLETAKAVKEAGTDIITSASYIFDSVNPAAAYELLLKV